MMGLRADRFVSLRVARPLRRTLLRERRLRVPILMYHSVCEGSSDSRAYYNVNTSPSKFAEQMKYLRDQDYRTIRPGQAVEILSEDEPQQKYVVITFDDGFLDFASAAYPILKEFGASATLYVPTGLIGDRRKRFIGKECLTWSEVRELHTNGIEIGSHSVTHPELKSLHRAKLDSELGESRNTIEDKLGSEVSSFAYPFAFPETDRSFVRRLKDSLQENGYKTCVTTVVGCANRSSDPLCLPRLPVNSDDDLELFAAKLEGSYDWLHTAQYVSKSVKDNLRLANVWRRSSPDERS